MTSEELANVQCPVLIIQVRRFHLHRLSRDSLVSWQAERSQTHPMEYAQQLRQALVNVPGGAQLFTVKGNYFTYLTEL